MAGETRRVDGRSRAWYCTNKQRNATAGEAKSILSLKISGIPETPCYAVKVDRTE